MGAALNPYKSKQDYATPKVFVDAVKHLLGVESFGFDFAADSINTQAGSYFNAEVDALSIPDWELWIPNGGWGWLNPPYTNIGPWAKRCMETGQRGANIALLVPASVGSNWFRDYVAGHASVLFLNGRLAFMPDKPTWLYPKDCMLCLFDGDEHNTDAPDYVVWNWREDVRRQRMSGLEEAGDGVVPELRCTLVEGLGLLHGTD